MGNKTTKTPDPSGASSASSSTEDGGGCPIKGKTTKKAAPEVKEGGGCPIKGKKSTVYNVYAQPIDPTNQMPATPNQVPAPGQQIPLSTDRVTSTIPKGGTAAETWTYPSPQMFWNALVRKGKAKGATEEDMDVVVAIHNNMNENTWCQVLEWEKVHQAHEGKSVPPDAQSSRLSRFMGRPDGLSPKAWFKSLFGHPLPFDRHDWIVQRPDGSEVRYVIDYYHDDEAAKQNKVPKLHDPDSVKSISLDVRPALDSLDALMDRFIRMPYSRFSGQTSFHPLPFFSSISPSSSTTSPSTPSSPSLSKEKLNALSRQVHETCKDQMATVRTCKDEESCAKAAIGLSFCMGQILCKDEASRFSKAWEANGGQGQAVEDAYTKMTGCLEAFEEKAKASRSS